MDHAARRLEVVVFEARRAVVVLKGAEAVRAGLGREEGPAAGIGGLSVSEPFAGLGALHRRRRPRPITAGKQQNRRPHDRPAAEAHRLSAVKAGAVLVWARPAALSAWALAVIACC